VQNHEHFRRILFASNDGLQNVLVADDRDDFSSTSMAIAICVFCRSREMYAGRIHSRGGRQPIVDGDIDDVVVVVISLESTIVATVSLMTPRSS